MSTRTNEMRVANLQAMIQECNYENEGSRQELLELTRELMARLEQTEVKRHKISLKEHKRIVDDFHSWCSYNEVDPEEASYDNFADYIEEDFTDAEASVAHHFVVRVKGGSHYIDFASVADYFAGWGE